MQILNGKVVRVSKLEYGKHPIQNVNNFPWDPNRETPTHITNSSSFERWKNDILERYGDISVIIKKNPNKKFWYNDDWIIKFM